MSVLEEASYTRKDGQYLRWDHRCGRTLRVRSKIQAIEASYEDRAEQLDIAKKAWQRLEDAGMDPRLVCAHPEVFKAIPDASLHYRGVALLSRKRVQEITGALDTWERSPRPG